MAELSTSTAVSLLICQNRESSRVSSKRVPNGAPLPPTCRVVDLEQATNRVIDGNLRWTDFCPGAGSPLGSRSGNRFPANLLCAGSIVAGYSMIWQFAQLFFSKPHMTNAPKPDGTDKPERKSLLPVDLLNMT
jgi:hypothetical protein